MDISRLRNLIVEYKKAQKKLDEIKGEYERTKTSYELRIDLEKELEDEIRMAKEGNKEDLIRYWQDILKELFPNDKDLADKGVYEKCEKEILVKNQKLISYYEKKLKTIKKHLGARLSQLLENYEERNTLMGEDSSSKRASHTIFEDDEKELERKEKERKTSTTFDKM
ncbi:MAG: hypothetical protein M0R48_07825 [Candidatus Omnitrophica bacterium]|jgi:hypothetical protein|nr:hypothetical protein [Candidatus Omnitrophota bacterium]